MDSTSIRVRVALQKARESQQLTRNVVEAAIAVAKARLEQSVSK